MKQLLKQASVIIRMAWARSLVYRFSIVAYRVGEIAELLVLVLMWTAIYASGTGTIKGFTLSEMITYVLIGNMISAIVRNFVASFVSRDINEGRLSKFLIKPIPYARFIFFNEIGRAGFIMVFSVITQFILLLFFLNKIVINTDPLYLAIIALMIVFAFITEWLIGFIIGCAAFWTDEVDGIQVSADRIKRFFSGGYFPLTLLPPTIATIGTYLPFAYSFFVPAQLYLKKVSIHQGVIGIGVQLLWIVILSVVLRIIWKKGLKKYEATGA
ncbi:MAG: hypothetical protein RIQ72_422 [Candidatus Parcubacteria bacterium]|jgi:ABC-2 type transport system permease protein